MARALRALAQLMGWSCVVIGAFHLILGNAAIPGAGAAGATVDSWGRFMGASFAGYDWPGSGPPSSGPSRLGRCGGWPASSCWAGAGRLISLAVHGPPHWFQISLAAIELGLPPVFFRLASSEEHALRDGAKTAPTER
ncbi:hypothetical protein Stsp01_53540 [Streptomyces sp. NBRC 13847]|uniref:DUF4345 family protein n=1 Tax=Streptomyces TaxID=1883 RepID=UPI0024A0B6A6|nr:hypothetical protein Stsp01_53540 [Streptomyces sp. NBRC 13847]